MQVVLPKHSISGSLASLWKLKGRMGTTTCHGYYTGWHVFHIFTLRIQRRQCSSISTGRVGLLMAQRWWLQQAAELEVQGAVGKLAST